MGKWVFLVFPRKMQFSFYLVLFSFLLACFLAVFRYRKKKEFESIIFIIFPSGINMRIYLLLALEAPVFFYFNIPCTLFPFRILYFAIAWENENEKTKKNNNKHDNK